MKITRKKASKSKITASTQKSTTVCSSVSMSDLETLAKAALNATTEDELNKVISGLLPYNKETWGHYSEMLRSGEYSISAIGKMISDDLYWEMHDSNNDLIESSTSICSTYECMDDSISDRGDILTRNELLEIYNDSVGYDPVVDDYPDFDAWLDDTVNNGYLREVEELGDNEASPDVFYLDTEGIFYPELNHKYNEVELLEIYEDLKSDGDPVVTEYDSFRDWLEDTIDSGYLRKVTACDSINISEDAVESSTQSRPVRKNQVYKRYFIVLDRGGDGYNVYSPDRELEDEGFASLDAAKEFVDSITANSDVDSNDEDTDIEVVDQEFTSKDTSINSGKLPAIYRLVKFTPGQLVLDYGGGKFDNGVEYLADLGVTGLVYDPYNRTSEHNRNVIRQIRDAGGADVALCSNVLNVIKEPEARIAVLKNIRKLLKPSGKVYITVYEGSGTGEGKQSQSDAYQLNRKTADYLEEIQEVFPNAERKGKLISACFRLDARHAITSARKPYQIKEVCKEIQDELYDAASNLMQSPEFGFDLNDIADYLVVEVEPIYEFDDKPAGIKAEVRAELSYDGMDELAQELNPVVQKQDPEAYFDHVTGGIIDAYMYFPEVRNLTDIYDSEDTTDKSPVREFDPETIMSSTDFMSWYDNLPEKEQWKVDDIADEEGVPFYDEASDAELAFLKDQYENRKSKNGVRYNTSVKSTVTTSDELKSDIFNYLDEDCQYVDYDQKIIDVSETFDLSTEEAEKYIQDWEAESRDSGVVLNCSSSGSTVNLPGYAVEWVGGYGGGGVNRVESKYFRTPEERDKFADMLESKGAYHVKRYEFSNFYHTLPEVDSSSKASSSSNNRSYVSAKLVETPQSVVDDLIEILSDFNFELDDRFEPNPGRTWMDCVHLQVINRSSQIDESEIRSHVPREMINRIHNLEKSCVCPITWNFGVDEDGYVTGGLDIDKQWIPDEIDSSHDVETADEGTYKIRFYQQSGPNKGNLDHEEFFRTREDALKAYRKVFKRELYGLNPTVWVKEDDDWRRLMGDELVISSTPEFSKDVESIEAASYGGAYDIEDNQYFTKEEIVEFGYELAEEFSKWAGNVWDLDSTYINHDESGRSTYELNITDNDIWLGASVLVDMRKIRKPSDLQKYKDEILRQLKSGYAEYYDTDDVDASTAITAEVEYFDEDIEFSKVYDVEFDAEIDVEDDGYYKFTEDAKFSDIEDEEYDLKIDDADSVAENIQGLLEYNIPEEPGRYRVSGIAKLQYHVDNIFEARDTDDVEWDGTPSDSFYITDDARSEYDYHGSWIENLQVEKL